MIEEQLPELHILKNIQMDEIEKTEIRDTIVRFMASHPLPEKRNSAWFVRAQHKILSPYGNNISSTMTRFTVGALLLVLVSGGSLTYASTSALPGDFLYPIKINIKENIEASLKTEPEEKLAWQEKRVERRLDEIKTLKVKKNLSEKDVLIAKTILKEHVTDLKNTLVELKETGKQDVILATGAKLLTQTEEADKKEEAVQDVSLFTSEETKTEESSEKTTDPEKKDGELTKATIGQDVKIEKTFVVTEESSTKTKLQDDLMVEVSKQLTEIQKTVKETSGESDKNKKEEKVEETYKTEELPLKIKIEPETTSKEILKTKRK